MELLLVLLVGGGTTFVEVVFGGGGGGGDDVVGAGGSSLNHQVPYSSPVVCGANFLNSPGEKSSAPHGHPMHCKCGRW